MRILYLSPSGALGGAERALLEAVGAVRDSEPSWNLGLIAFEEGPLLERARRLGADAFTLPMPKSLAAAGESGRTRAATLLDLARSAGPAASYVRALRRRAAAWRPDLIHSNGIKAHVLAAWLGADAPVVWHVHDYLSTRPLSLRLLRHYAPAAAAVLANSRSVCADVSTALGARVPIRTVYNAIDDRRFRPDGPRLDLDARAGLAPPSDRVIRIGIVATFARWKGHDVFLRAVSELEHRYPLRAYVVGGPVYRTGTASQTSCAELQALACELGLTGRVGFTGFVEEPAEAYRALDIVVHASTSPEPFGLSIAEAMACGRPVVLSDRGGARELGEPGRTCLAHEPGDARDLAARLEQLLADPALRQRLGRAGEQFVRQRFTRLALGSALGSVYRELHGEAGAR